VLQIAQIILSSTGLSHFMPDDSAEKNLIRVKADATGIDLTVGGALPDLLARVLPAKFQIRRSVDKEIARRIVERIRSNSDFDEAELAFAEDMLSERAQKYIRLKHIQTRAYSLFEQTPSVNLIGSGGPSEQPPSETSEDWVNKFREDASLVDDELVREIYARVLAEETRRPSAFSLRTLGVLRYLDRDAATAFGNLQKVCLSGRLVPQQSPDKSHVLMDVGLNHATMLMLEDAGLVYSSAQSEAPLEGARLVLMASGYNRLLAIQRPDDSTIKANLEVHLLTPAGQQLARIAECEPDEPAFLALVNWLRSQLGDVKIQYAVLPSRDFSGKLDDLTWQPVGPDDNEEPTPQPS
jgi:hypothetical protein